MTLNRIGSVALLNNTLNHVTQVQERLGTLQTQISSGLKAETFEGLNGQVEFYTQLNSKLRLTNQLKDGNTTGIGRLQTADQSLSGLEETANSLINLITSSINSGAAPSLNLKQQVQGLLNQFSDQLNVTYDGRYIFGGTNTTQPPVASISASNATLGIPDDVYYGGSKDNVVYRANEQVTYAFPVRADDSAFQKIYAAANLAVSAFGSNDTAGLETARKLAQDGNTELIGARTRLNTTLVNTRTINTQLDAQSKYLEGLVGEVSNTDIVAATTQASNYEAILQATYQVYARLSQLKLSDYLK
ncbi:MAG: hypothetical protein ACKVOE_11045 [Rickettsiales bacterium]